MIVKTNWSPNDYLNYEDWNRIIGNVKTICTMGNYTGFTLEDNNTYACVIDFFQLNAIEQALKELNKVVQIKYWEEPKVDWKAFDTISYKDLNRIESHTYNIYNVLSGKPTLLYTGEITSGQKEQLGGATRIG
jgi:hypothetical protein